MMMQLSGTEQGAPPKGGSGTAWPITDCEGCKRKQVECRRLYHTFYCKACYRSLKREENLKPLTQWEYIEFTFREFADLQERGREGWEIISITPQASGYRHAVGKRELRPETYIPKAVVEREVRESD